MAAIVLLAMVSAPAQAGSFSFLVQPPRGGAPVKLGGYSSLGGCRDWLGECQGSEVPGQVAYGAPGICSADCFEDDTAIAGGAQHFDWAFIIFTADGTGAVKATYRGAAQCERERAACTLTGLCSHQCIAEGVTR